MYKRGTTRQGFGGNYRRSGESSPKPLSPEITSVKPFNEGLSPSREANVMDTSNFETSLNTTTKMTDGGTSTQCLGKLYVKQPVGKRTFYPALTKTKSESLSVISVGSNSHSHTSLGAASTASTDDQGESPSVRTCIATFENWSPRSQRRFGQSSVTKTKVSELRDSLLQKSNENLTDSDQRTRRGSDQERCSPSSLGRSNESLDERFSPIQSVESVSNRKQNTLHQVSSTHHELDTGSSYGDHFISEDHQENSTSSQQDEIILPPLPTAKPTSPTLESGYNSHNTPDNRSIISELSLSSAGSGSLSVTSRNSSTVSKDSLEFPVVPQSVTVVHVRQKSVEEIECEQQVAQLVRQLPESEKQRISEVILPLPEHKTATDFMSGLFDTHINDRERPNVKDLHSNQSSIDINNKKNETSRDVYMPTSSMCWSSVGLTQQHQQYTGDNGITSEDKDNLMVQKAELIKPIEKKLQILQAEKTKLEQEVEENNNMGQEITKLVEVKAPSSPDYRKFKIYLDELDTVLKLLLKVSGQLARAENAVMNLPEGSDNSDMVALRAKRDDLSQKHEDAKQLKEGIDMRSQQVTSCLKQCLTTEQYMEYEYFIKMKSRLKLEQQEINDKIRLSEEQLAALKKML
ncbi:hypothetical protein LSH36_344g02030 [Paralvinella palmiformis]|uniref:ASD2 domain-containing protein n=1 Tax=Paralvinella palmiformis TaxID=53620 RepID=A0AAD9JF36_9ANNE|nr:hypothetical protein LSH36_344g02030 [Paralvinella palmiformis]